LVRKVEIIDDLPEFDRYLLTDDRVRIKRILQIEQVKKEMKNKEELKVQN